MAAFFPENEDFQELRVMQRLMNCSWSHVSVFIYMCMYIQKKKKERKKKSGFKCSYILTNVRPRNSFRLKIPIIYFFLK